MPEPTPGTFQFNQGDPTLPKPPQLPPHIQGMALSDETKVQLAALEKVMGDQAKPLPPAPPIQRPESPPKAVEPPQDLSYLGFLGEDEDADGSKKDPLFDADLKAAIESRCSSLSLIDLITRGRVTQRVPIVPNEFEAVFQTLSGEEDLFIKDRLLGVRGSNMAIQQRYADMILAIGLVSINGDVLPPYQANDVVEPALFDARLAMIRRMPTSMLASLHINYAWFDGRTRKLFSFRGNREAPVNPARVG